jgi:hypothetical protein
MKTQSSNYESMQRRKVNDIVQRTIFLLNGKTLDSWWPSTRARSGYLLPPPREGWEGREGPSPSILSDPRPLLESDQRGGGEGTRVSSWISDSSLLLDSMIEGFRRWTILKRWTNKEWDGVIQGANQHVQRRKVWVTCAVQPFIWTVQLDMNTPHNFLINVYNKG